MSTDLTTINALPSIGEIANAYAAKMAFTTYQGRIARNTLRRQIDDLNLFTSFLASVNISIPITINGPTINGKAYPTLMCDPQSWQVITYGLVETFIGWQLRKGFAIGSINVRLATIKAYCALAAKSGYLTPESYALIKLVKSYRSKEGRNEDEKRVANEEATRIGSKKAESIPISKEQALQLKHGQPDTPQGKRDALLMCLLLDHGFRCGEIAALEVRNLDTKAGTLTFYRRKVDKTQIHELTNDTRNAAIAYLETCKPETYLLVGSRKGGAMEGRMQERSITERVRVLCEQVGVTGASAHDGRHAYVSSAIRKGTDLKTLQDAGGWNSIAMPAHYADSQKVANKGVVLDY